LSCEVINLELHLTAVIKLTKELQQQKTF